MQKMTKNEIFGHFIQLGWFHWSDIANNDNTKCFSTFNLLNVEFWLFLHKSC